MRNLSYIISGFLVISTLHYAQLTVKDKESTPNILMQVNDEGDAGSITLQPLSSIGTNINKLYNLGGSLYWNASKLGLSESSGWQRIGGKVTLQTNTDYVGIGNSDPQVNLDITSSAVTKSSKIRLGNFDNTHTLFLFSGNSTEVPYISFTDGDALRFAKYDGTVNELMRITSDGRVGIGTNNPSSPLHAQGTNSYSKLATINDGVYGESNTTGGSGIAGINTGSGNGVYGRSTSGYAGKFDGDIKVGNSVISDKIKSNTNNSLVIESLNNNIVLKSGNTIVTIKPSGEILIQSSSEVSISTEADLNLNSQGNLNLSGNNVNIGASNSVFLTGVKNINMNTGIDFNLDSGNDFKLTASKNMFLESNDSLALKTNNTLVLENLNAFNKMSSNGDINIEGKDITIKASGSLITKGSNP